MIPRTLSGFVVSTTLALGASGCLPHIDPRPSPQIGLHRGARWSVLSIDPPNLSGPFFNLVLREHVLTGFVSGETAPGGALRVHIEPDHVAGFGPLGPVAMDIEEQPEALAIEGMWNGQRCKLAFTSDGMRATVADNVRPAVRPPLGPGLALEPAARDSSCQYVLDHRDPDGGLSGTSICAGMPQQTRLEVPAVADALLTHAELVTVLVAFLSAPPVAASEPFPRRVEAGLDGVW
jgi:hypothetical protein